MNLWVIFITGLTVGGLTCLAVQGGLLASVIAERDKKHTIWATASFLLSKLVSYTILGFILGAFGGALNINPIVQTIMQLLAGLYMIAVALNLLNIHPIFRYVIIQPPRFLTRLVKNQSKSKDLFAPGILGAMTVFIPCGTTIAMETLAIASANALFGAAIMAAFVLGTMPLFVGVGLFTSIFQGKFLKLAAFVVLYLGITSLNGSLLAMGSPVTLQSIRDAIPIQIDFSGDNSTALASSLLPVIDGVQTANIAVFPNGYSPSYIQVKSGVPVKLNLSTTGGFGCTVGFRIPKFGIAKDLSRQNQTIVEFTPQKSEKITWTCSMGMYRGIIEVI